QLVAEHEATRDLVAVSTRFESQGVRFVARERRNDTLVSVREVHLDKLPARGCNEVFLVQRQLVCAGPPNGERWVGHAEPARALKTCDLWMRLAVFPRRANRQ